MARAAMAAPCLPDEGRVRAEPGIKYHRSTKLIVGTCLIAWALKTAVSIGRGNKNQSCPKIRATKIFCVLDKGYSLLIFEKGGLQEIEIPENVEYIDDEAFLGCTSLRKVIMRSKHIKGDHWLPDELRGEVQIL